MEAAWQQVGKVLEAKPRIRFGQMAMLTSICLARRKLGALRQLAPSGCSRPAPVQAGAWRAARDDP